MADLATLGIKVDATGAIQAVDKLGASFDTLAAKEKRRAQQAQDIAYQDRFRTDEAARAMGLLEMQAYKLAQAQEKGVTASTNAAGGVMRVREAVTSMTATIVGSAPGVAQLTSVLGAQAIGAPVIVGVLAGVAAMTLAWRAWHEEADKAKEEQDKLTKALFDWYKVQQQGPGKGMEEQLAAMTKLVKELHKELDGAASSSMWERMKSLTSSVGAGGSKPMAWARVAMSTLGFGTGDALSQLTAEAKKGREVQTEEAKKANDAIAAGKIELAKRIKDAQDKADKDRLTAEDRATADAIERYNARTREYEKQYKEQTNITVRELDEQLDAIKRMEDEATAYRIAQQAEQTSHAQKTYDKTLAETVKAMEKQDKYVEDMRKNWRNGLNDIISHGLTSFSGFFESVLGMFNDMLATMEKAGKAGGLGGKLLGIGSAAIGGGLAGYSIGQSSGSKTLGALGGAASGALMGSQFGPVGAAVGALAGFVGGILGAGKAAKEAAKHMADLQKSLQLSIDAIKASLAGDELGIAIAQIKADFVALRKATEDAFSGGGANSETVRQRNAKLAELNDLEAQRIARATADHNLKLAAQALAKKQLEEDLAAQILRNNGNAEAADAMEKALEQERRFAELRAQGISDAMLAELAQSEAKRDADADALAAAEKLKEAAAALAAEAEKAAQQARDLQDLDVELLGAQGNTQGAADMAFQLAQQRRLEEAQKNQTDEYVQKLLELQQIQRDQRAADQLIAATSGGSALEPMARGGREASTSAVSAVSATVTERTAYALVDIGRQQLSAQLQMVDLLSALVSGGGGARSMQDVNEFLGSGVLSSARYAGSVTR